MPSKLRSNRQSQYLHYLFRLSCMCGTVAAILGMQSVGGGSLRGELCFQVKTEGTTPFIKETKPLKLFFKSPVNETLLLCGIIYYSHTHTGGGGADITGPVRVIWPLGHTRWKLLWATTLHVLPTPFFCWINARNRTKH